MPCFTSQLTNLRPKFVRPPVPRQSNHVIWHMVRYNTEAYPTYKQHTMVHRSLGTLLLADQLST